MPKEAEWMRAYCAGCDTRWELDMTGSDSHVPIDQTCARYSSTSGRKACLFSGGGMGGAKRGKR